MTDVKICGLTRTEDVELACALGAAYVGFNFAAGSPRRVGPERARALADATAPGVLRVGVFRAEPPEVVDETVRGARLDLVQLHRPVTHADLARLAVPLIAAVPSAEEGRRVPVDVLARCHAILIDASEGAGVPLDVAWLRDARFPVPVFLAGGIDADTVGGVIRALRPAAVDVASGAERSPGVKDSEKLTRLFEAVREADSEAG